VQKGLAQVKISESKRIELQGHI
jgi:hypothetical protein